MFTFEYDTSGDRIPKINGQDCMNILGFVVQADAGEGEYVTVRLAAIPDGIRFKGEQVRLVCAKCTSDLKAEEVKEP